jgi:hypothetical protein
VIQWHFEHLQLLDIDFIRKRWQTIELEKAVDKIHNKQQD